MPPALVEFAADVQRSLNLSPRQLSSRYFYDPLGSALFDAICRLPWYRITRAERGLLDRHGDEVLRAVAPECVVELGAGNGEKLATLLTARTRSTPAPLEVHLVDVSKAALDTAALALAAHEVRVVRHEAGFLPWLEQAADSRKGRPASRTLTLFLGSNIGNFDRDAANTLLRRVRATLGPGDAFLLGADLVKPEADLLLSYDDPLGVTAAFNRNLLVRINRELGGRIDIGRFRHRALWNEAESRVEMHLVSTCRQQIEIPPAGVDVTFQAGESIWTESSYKYAASDLEQMVEDGGFRCRRQWVDADAAFALTLADVP